VQSPSVSWPPGEGETLSTDEQAFRLSMVGKVLSYGKPLSDLDIWADEITGSSGRGFRLPGSEHLGRLVPLVERAEKQRVLSLLQSPPCEVVFLFDGVSHQGDLQVFILRWVDKDWNLRRAMCDMDHKSYSVDASTLRKMLVEQLMSVPFTRVLGTVHDACSVNMKAVADLEDTLPGKCFGVDLICIPHRLADAGKRFLCPKLDKLRKKWLKFFKNSPKRSAAWSAMFDYAPRTSFNKVKWHSWHTLHRFLYDHWGDLFRFVQELNAGPMADDVASLRACVTYETAFELASVVEAGSNLCYATYGLEGDDPILFIVHDAVAHVLRGLTHYLTSQSLPPSVRALLAIRLQHHPTPLALKFSTVESFANIIRPVHRYLVEQMAKWSVTFGLAEAASIFAPWHISDAVIDGGLHDDARLCIATLRHHRLLSENATDDQVYDEFVTAKRYLREYHMVPPTEEELFCKVKPSAKDKARENTPALRVLNFWRGIRGSFEFLAPVVKRLATLTCTSATCERAFSLFQRNHTDNDNLDLLTARTMMHYNRLAESS
jgi:hAT family C-terminal dimerisation region